MYIPKLFHESSWPEIRKVIEENSFATVITCNAGLPTATHVPLRLLESATGTAKLQGHMSRANPHWRLFEQEQQSLVIFSGQRDSSGECKADHDRECSRLSDAVICSRNIH
jgi:transcriptional regulator